MIIAKKCRFCQRPFEAKFSSTQTVCSPGCGMALYHTTEAKKREKAYDKVTKERKEKLKTHKDFMNELQVIFNKYIRLRDAKEPCICCGAVGDYKWDCGHYLSRGSHPWLAVNEDNCHKQRARPCNSDLSGNQAKFRIGLIAKIGLERVEALENCHNREKLTIDEIKLKMAHYKKLIKEMKE